MKNLRRHAEQIYGEAIRRALPDAAVREALRDFRPGSGRTLLIAVGKAAWRMASAALEAVDADGGLVVTKYGHSQGPLSGLEILEAGHPVADAASFAAAERALALVRGLKEGDTVLFLLSGGGSALFESSDLSLEEFREVNRRLLACGADIVEINTIRKRLSAVKGGRFAQLCAPARVFAIVLSDILGDPNILDMIASGPAAVDASTLEETLAVAEKYALKLSPQARALLTRPLPAALPHVESHICGSVSQLCQTAAEVCRELGYEARILTDQAAGEARETGEALAQSLLREREAGKPLALILGGETVVKLTGGGKGGRNQELALAAAPILAETEGTALFSVGSDGTDGPTDAAGGYVDGGTRDALRDLGVEIPAVLAENDSYHALKRAGGLIVTGPTGTNVNDLSAALFWPPDMP